MKCGSPAESSRRLGQPSRRSMTHESWDARIARAEQLAAESEAARELLEFYAHLLRAQKRIYDDLRGRGDWLPSGRIERDLPALRASMPAFLRAVADRGSQALVEGERRPTRTSLRRPSSSRMRGGSRNRAPLHSTASSSGTSGAARSAAGARRSVSCAPLRLARRAAGES
jgi:hypothetical protein